VYIYYDPEGYLQLTENGVEGGQTIPLTFSGKTLPIEILLKFPHLKGLQTFRVADEYLDLLPDVLRGQIAIGAIGLDGSPQGAAALQIPGVLDDLYAEAAWNATLGVEFTGEIPTLKVWAPTAKSVNLLLYPSSLPLESGGGGEGDPESIPMEFDSTTGIWSVTGETEWKGYYYLYDVEVFIRQQGEFVHNLVTDPYSFNLNTNGTRSQIVDLNDPALLPAGWLETAKPELAAFTDIVLYELHLRDFSAIDESVPQEQRGTYLAFTNPESAGMQHLAGLAKAGVTHIHLLPLFDIATINENKAEWQNPDFNELRSYPPDSDKQQALVNPLRGLDAYNWGYDPFHYTAPEGSYSTTPEGTARILEFRQMVQALNAAGLRVVMDVVYNHTNAAGQGDKSVLDKIVPGYYHRLDFKGEVTNSTCCANTATEHDMMRKLMIDSVLTWATAYKVDGFRFDLMGHHMKDDMVALRQALDTLTPEADGVDGSMIYVYGEGWDFGEVAGNTRGINATQANMAGTGIGTFNDRGRDAVRGGTPFSPKQDQGFATGMYVDPNEANPLTENEQLAKLLLQKDQLRVTLAGNLADFQFIGADGELTSGAEVDYEGQPAGYTASPQENIIYVSAHDNETLFDALQYKLPASATLEDRIQAQSLALSVVAFSQGVPFFHAGSELLRSKSMDRDSYDSTDWFNALDWTYNDNGWGHGLPLQDKNGENWPLIQPLLANPDSAPSQSEILQMQDLFKQWINIRQSSPLFRLQTAEQIQNQLRFHNTGPDQVPGLIVMSISDDPANELDPNYGAIFVLWNAAPEEAQFTLEGYEIGNLELHPLLTDAYNSQASYDTGTQSFNLPGRSVVVFVGDTPLSEPGPKATLQPEVVEPAPEPKPTEIPATEKPELSPTANSPFPEELPQTQAEQSNLWAYLLGGAALIATGIGAFWWSKRKK
jgi:pullulanase